MGNSFGDIFRITTFGESHGEAIGVVIDGCPAGVMLTANCFLADMQRRRPGISPLTSPRNEADEVQIVSGVFEDITLGTTIALIIKNHNQRPQDYDEFKDVFRPAHGDFTYHAKFGYRDHRGGGRASGRETAARVAAGVVAKMILSELGVVVESNFEISDTEIKSGDSIGSTVLCTIKGLKAGIGKPVFGKLDADISKALMSIGGSRAVEFCVGIKAAEMCGSEHNPLDKGILAGISDGNDIVVKIYFKPPPTIGGKGRHDTVIAPRAAVVCEAMIAITLVDHIFAGFSDTMTKV
ncbi:MAG: chorismate synthase, partial [Defluviitaleaceae bacterium]|nr:chorismate synthase [Defluviitaleaceae bacterium]